MSQLHGLRLLLDLQALRRLQAAQRAVLKKLKAKQSADLARSVVAAFKPFVTAPTESGLSIAWQIILPRLADHFCNVRLEMAYCQYTAYTLSNLETECSYAPPPEGIVGRFQLRT